MLVKVRASAQGHSVPTSVARPVDDGNNGDGDDDGHGRGAYNADGAYPPYFPDAAA